MERRVIRRGATDPAPDEARHETHPDEGEGEPDQVPRARAPRRPGEDQEDEVDGLDRLGDEPLEPHVRLGAVAEDDTEEEGREERRKIEGVGGAARDDDRTDKGDEEPGIAPRLRGRVMLEPGGRGAQEEMEEQPADGADGDVDHPPFGPGRGAHAGLHVADVEDRHRQPEGGDPDDGVDRTDGADQGPEGVGPRGPPREGVDGMRRSSHRHRGESHRGQERLVGGEPQSVAHQEPDGPRGDDPGGPRLREGDP